MNQYRFGEPAILPLQEALIYGLICEDTSCQRRHFATVRYQESSIVKYINHWTEVVIGTSNQWVVNCPNHLLTLGVIFEHWNRNRIQLTCGLPTRGFVIRPVTRTVPPSDAVASAVCPDVRTDSTYRG